MTKTEIEMLRKDKRNHLVGKLLKEFIESKANEDLLQEQVGRLESRLLDVRAYISECRYI